MKVYKARLELEGLKIRVYSNSKGYLKSMRKELSFYVDGYFWTPSYQSGQWDGKASFFTKANLMPFGILPDFLKIHKKKYADHVKLIADDGVKKLYKGPNIDIKYDLSLQPYPYQQEAIEICLKRTKGIIRSATASGKSLLISYIIKNLLDNRDLTNVRRSIVIVPSQGLVEQFKSDMVEYGINGDYIGKVYTGFKEWNRAICITTWQSLKNNLEKLSMYDCIIGDEAHGVKAYNLKKIFKKSHAHYRFGFTGTLPNNMADYMNVKAYIGPVLKEYPSGFLAEEGYIAKCNVKALILNYSNIESNYYNDIRSEVFHNPKRVEFITKMVNEIDDNVLLLVAKISEGNKLEMALKRRTDKEVIFLSGKDKVDIREEWRQKMMNGKNIALIATYGIFQQGINIPNLKYAILASPTKSKIRTLQSVGRALRKHENKIDGAVILDLIDNVKYLDKHGDRRLRFYHSEGFDIEEIELKERNSFAENLIFS